MLVWILFLSLILLLLAVDLGIFHRKAHVVTAREGLAWCIVWMTLAFAFSTFIYGAYEHKWFGLGLLPDPDRDGLLLLSSYVPEAADSAGTRPVGSPVVPATINLANDCDNDEVGARANQLRANAIVLLHDQDTDLRARFIKHLGAVA